MEIIPTKDFLLVKLVKKDSLIVAPDNTKITEHDKFIVTKLGKDVKEIKVGDEITVIKNGILQTKINGQLVHFTSESAVLLVVRDESKI